MILSSTHQTLTQTKKKNIINNINSSNFRLHSRITCDVMTNNNNITHTQKEKQTARADDSIMDDKLFVMMLEPANIVKVEYKKKYIKRYFSPSHLNSQVMSKRHVCAKLRQVHHKIFNNKIVLLTSLHRI